MGILTKIRQRPEHQKKLFSFVSAGVITLVIVTVWFSFNNVSSGQTAEESSKKLSSVSPFQVIKDEFSKAFSGLPDLGGNSSTTSTSTVPIEIVSDGVASSSDGVSTSTENPFLGSITSDLVSTSSTSTKKNN